jgi:hypothetical protein
LGTDRHPTTVTTTNPTAARRRHITRISGEIKNWPTIRAASTSPSRHGVRAWRTTIAYSEPRISGGKGRTMTETCPNVIDVTMADEYP